MNYFNIFDDIHMYIRDYRDRITYFMSEPIVSDNILEMIVNDKRLYYDKFKN